MKAARTGHYPPVKPLATLNGGRSPGGVIRREGGFGSQSCKSFLHAPLWLLLETAAVAANWWKGLSAQSYEKKMSVEI